jgi:hypothetical protein
LIGIALVISGVLLALVAWEPYSTDPPAELNANNFTLVKVGMTQDEVEKLLGGPPGDYGRNKREQGFMTVEMFTGPQGSVEKVWFDDNNRFELFSTTRAKLSASTRERFLGQSPTPIGSGDS